MGFEVPRRISEISSEQNLIINPTRDGPLGSNFSWLKIDRLKCVWILHKNLQFGCINNRVSTILPILGHIFNIYNFNFHHFFEKSYFFFCMDCRIIYRSCNLNFHFDTIPSSNQSKMHCHQNRLLAKSYLDNVELRLRPFLVAWHLSLIRFGCIRTSKFPISQLSRFGAADGPKLTIFRILW